jgi:hypothetical protein
MRARLLALGDCELMAKDQYLGVLPPPLAPRQAQQRHDPGDNEEDQLQAHKPKIIARPPKAQTPPPAAGHGSLSRRHPLASAQVTQVFGTHRVDPVRQWKLSPMDIESLDKWDAYTEAKEAMFFYTDTAEAPWTVVKSNGKKRARLEAIKHVLAKINYAGKDEEVTLAWNSSRKSARRLSRWLKVCRVIACDTPLVGYARAKR